jgi:hypothetical protein
MASSSGTIEFSAIGKSRNEPRTPHSPTDTETSSSSTSSPYPFPWDPAFEEIDLDTEFPVGTSDYGNHHRAEPTSALFLGGEDSSRVRRRSFLGAMQDVGVYVFLVLLAVLYISRIPFQSASTATTYHFDVHPQVLQGALLALSGDGTVVAISELAFQPPQDKDQDNATWLLQVYCLIRDDDSNDKHNIMEQSISNAEAGRWYPMGQPLDFYYSSSINQVVDLSANGTVMALISSTSRTVRVLEYHTRRDKWLPQAGNDQLLGAVEAEIRQGNTSFTTRLSANAVSLSADATALVISGKSVMASTGATRSHVMAFRFDGTSWIATKGGGELLQYRIRDGIDESLGQSLILQSMQLSRDGTTLVMGGHYSENDHSSSKISVVKVFKLLVIPTNSQNDLQEETGLEWVNAGGELALVMDDPFIGKGISLSHDGNVLALANTNNVQVFSYTGQVFNGRLRHEWTPLGVDSIAPKHSFEILSVALSAQGDSFAVGRVMIDDATIGMVDFYQYHKGGHRGGSAHSGSKQEDGHWEHVNPALNDDEAFMFGNDVALSSTTLFETDNWSEATLAIGATGKTNRYGTLRAGGGEVYIYRLSCSRR